MCNGSTSTRHQDGDYHDNTEEEGLQHNLLPSKCWTRLPPYFTTLYQSAITQTNQLMKGLQQSTVLLPKGGPLKKNVPDVLNLEFEDEGGSNMRKITKHQDLVTIRPLGKCRMQGAPVM